MDRDVFIQGWSCHWEHWGHVIFILCNIHTVVGLIPVFLDPAYLGLTTLRVTKSFIILSKKREIYIIWIGKNLHISLKVQVYIKTPNFYWMYQHWIILLFWELATTTLNLRAKKCGTKRIFNDNKTCLLDIGDLKLDSQQKLRLLKCTFCLHAQQCGFEVAENW